MGTPGTLSSNKTNDLLAQLGRSDVTSEHLDFIRMMPEMVSEVGQVIVALCDGQPSWETAMSWFEPGMFFGPDEWRKYYDVDLIEEQLDTIDRFAWGRSLDNPCPFETWHKNSRVRRTHFAFLGLENMWGQPLTVDHWQTVLKATTRPGPVIDRIVPGHDQANSVKTCAFRWYLLCFDRSGNGYDARRNETYESQARRLPPTYRPASAIELTTACILFHTLNGRYPFATPRKCRMEADEHGRLSGPMVMSSEKDGIVVGSATEPTLDTKIAPLRRHPLDLPNLFGKYPR